MKKIKLLAVDVDGCITPGEGTTAEIAVIKRLRELNERSESEPDVPAITLCTGRQQPFVDLLSQLIGTRAPAIFENGAGIHEPETYSFYFHPSITDENRRRLRDFERAIEKDMVAAGKAKLQPGKEVSLSVYPAEGYTVADNARQLRKLLRDTGADFFLDVSILCINVLFPGIDKGAGVKWLAKFMGLGLDEIGAVGDAPGDLPAFEAAGFAACPANAEKKVKKAADFVAQEENGRGVIRIVDEVIYMNADRE